MKYLILDYGKGMINCRQKTKHFRLYKKFQQYQTLRKLMPAMEIMSYCNMEFVYIVFPVNFKVLGEMPADKIQKKLYDLLDKDESYRVFASQPELLDYIPPELEWCEDLDEIYLSLLEHSIKELCDGLDLNKNNGTFLKRNARLLFIDDGKKEVFSYIRQLSKDWNYVTVCSNRHEELEMLYRELYEEEGLMVECADFPHKHSCQGDIVIDLTTNWHGLHRIYPEGSYVLDTTFSKEKEKYLKAKQVRLDGYVQMADWGNIRLPADFRKSLTKSRE